MANAISWLEFIYRFWQGKNLYHNIRLRCRTEMGDYIMIFPGDDP
jgi:hypothetical protein